MSARYLDLLGDSDLQALAEAAGFDGAGPGASGAEMLRSDPALIPVALTSELTFARIMTAEPSECDAGPTLIFAVLIHRAAAEVAEAGFVTERVGRNTLIPVFDQGALGEYATDPAHRLFLIELLGSYTKVVSGPRWVRRGERWRKQKFSELDAGNLVLLLDGADESEQSGVYRRLGDLALFVTGVFPDHSAQRTVPPIELERLLRSLPAGARAQVADESLDTLMGRGSTAALFAGFGPIWYRLAALGQAADSFDQARRFLTFVTDRYLFNKRDWLFPFSPN
jgi:hypothetical protein